jgi:hypothetical protein
MDFTHPQVIPGVGKGVASGAHYPRQGASLEAWVSWYARSATVAAAAVVVDGPCTPMTLERGSATNGAWRAVLTGLDSACHRYYFVFEDSDGQVHTYPTTGSFGIGDDACPDSSTERPALGAGCGPVAECEPGPGGCDDANPCTVDTCDPAVGCSHAVLPDGASCGDGNACNGAETCSSGACTPGAPLSCPAADVCTVSACDPAAGCVFLPRSCDDGNPCTVDGCDPGSGCTHAAAPATTECSDGLACNGVERCDGAGACVAGPTCEASPPSHRARSGCGSAGADGSAASAAAVVLAALASRFGRRRPRGER